MKDDSCRVRCWFFFPIAILAFVSLLTFAVYALWNGVVTDLFGLSTITYWQALGLLVLCKILFGGFPGGRRGCGGPKGWRERSAMKKQWASLEPAERARLREEMRHRFGDWPRPSCGGPESDEAPPADSDRAPRA